MLVLLALIALASARTSILDLPLTMSWEDWKTHFGKTFENEEAFRSNYEHNIRHIKRENAKEHTYKLGVNEYAHLHPDEFYAMYTMSEPHQVPEEKNYPPQLLNQIEQATSIDWVTAGKVTPVKNQGQCGSCWAFSTTGSVEAAEAIASGNSPVSLSEQQLVDCAASFGNNGCNGGLMDNGFKYIEHVDGLAEESTYPYTAATGTCNSSEAAQHVTDISGYVDVQETDAAMMTALNIGPVSIAIEADKSAFQLYRSGVLTDSAGCGTNLDHGVLAVGYGSLNGTDYYKVKNSWGANWGMDGYILMGRGSQYPSGMCGMLKSASYPTGAHAVSPGPTPAPGPGPSPTGGHYGKPATDGSCEDGDTALSVTGLSGNFCSPQCASNLSCPNPPSGWSGLAMCALTMPTTGAKYCAVECFGLTGECGATGASCQMVSGQSIGICLYPQGVTEVVFAPRPRKQGGKQ